MPVASFREDLARRLEDTTFRRAFGAAQIKSSLALVLREARTREGLSQTELAHLVDVTQAYIAKLESGEANPTVGHLGEILAVLWQGLDVQVRPLLKSPPRLQENIQAQPSRYEDAVLDNSWAKLSTSAIDTGLFPGPHTEFDTPREKAPAAC